MFQRTHVPATLVATVFAVVVVAGCGGGGGKTDGGNGNGGDNINVVVLPPQDANATFMTKANTTTVQAVGDLKITVPSGTFATPAQVTITRSQPATLPQFDGFTPVQNANVQIVTSAQPRLSITIEPVVSAQTRDASKTIWRYLVRAADNTWRIISDVTNDTRMVIDKAKFVVNGVVNVVDGIVGYFLIEAPDTTTGLVKLATDPTGNEYSAMVFVHGFNNTAEDFQLAATKFSQYEGGMIDRPRDFYSFQYDYRQHCAESAQQLADLLEEFPYANISITAHSAGVVVVRDMIENKRCHRYLTGVSLINGANLGSWLAGAAALVKDLNEDILNNQPTRVRSLLATVGDPVVADLSKGSSYLNSLNTASHQRPIQEAYLLVGGTLDPIVGVDSGLGTGIPFESMLSGTVNRVSLAVDHSSLVKTSAGINWLLSVIYGRGGAFVSVTTNPNGGNLQAGADGWDYQIIVNNGEDFWITVDNIGIECYDLSGIWTGLRSVVDGFGNTVDGYARCNLEMSPHSQLVIYMHEWINSNHILTSQAPLTLLGRNLDMRVLFTDDGKQFGWNIGVRLCYGDVQPASPITRRRPHP